MDTGRIIQVSSGTALGAVDEYGNLWTWRGQDYECGVSNTYSDDNGYVEKPTKALENVTFTSISSGIGAAITEDSLLWMWGNNEHYQYGINYIAPPGEYQNSSMPTNMGSQTPVVVMNDVKCVSVDTNRACIIKNDGSLWVTGLNEYGERGVFWNPEDYPTDYISPSKVMDNVSDVSCGNASVAAIKIDGSLWTWGNNAFGKLGIGKGRDDEFINYYNEVGEFGVEEGFQSTPQQIMEDVVSVSMGTYHCVAVKKDGRLWAWGSNQNGQLGTGTTESSYTPVKIMDNVISARAGNENTAAIKNDGTLWIWGNYFGEFNINDIQTAPIKLLNDVSAVDICVKTVIVKTDGTLWTWDTLKSALIRLNNI